MAVDRLAMTRTARKATNPAAAELQRNPWPRSGFGAAGCQEQQGATGSECGVGDGVAATAGVAHVGDGAMDNAVEDVDVVSVGNEDDGDTRNCDQLRTHELRRPQTEQQQQQQQQQQQLAQHQQHHHHQELRHPHRSGKTTCQRLLPF